MVHERGRRAAHHKSAWEWAVTRRESVSTLVDDIAPLLLHRRRAAIEFILRAAGKAVPPTQEIQPGSPEAWAWVAGLIEGEGWICPGPGAVRRKLIVAAQSTDHDVIERLAALTEVGHIASIPRQQEHFKSSWRWSVYNQPDSRRILSAILPMLGARRSERARYVLNLIGGE